MQTTYLTPYTRSRVIQTIVIVLGGALIAFLTAGIMKMSMIWLVLVPTAIAVIIPTFIVKDMKIYWLGVFLLSLPFSIQKILIDSQVALNIEDTFGKAAGTMPVPVLFLSDLPFIVLIVLWLIRVAVKKDALYFPKNNVFALAFLGWSALSIIGSTLPSFGVFQLLQLIKYYAGYLFFANNIKTRKDLRIIVVTLMAGLLLQGMVCVFQYTFMDAGSIFGDAFGKKEVSKSIEKSQVYNAFESGSSIKRVGGTVGPSNVQAQYFVLTLPLAFLLGIASAKKRNMLYYLSVFMPGMVGMILTFSRGGLVSIMAGLIVALLVSYRRRLISFRFISTVAFCVISGLVMLSPLMYDYMSSRPEAFGGRFDSYRIGLEVAKSNLLFGVGLNNSTALLSNFDPAGLVIPHHSFHISIHNWYLVVAGEIGLLGLIFILIFFIKSLADAFRNTALDDRYISTVAVGILAGLSGLLIYMGGDVFRNNAVLVIMWMFAGLSAAMNRKEFDQQD